MIRFHKPFLAALLLAALATGWLAWSRLDTARRWTGFARFGVMP